MLALDEQIFQEFAEASKRRSISLTPAREKCNKCDLIAAPRYWLANHNDWSSWFTVSNSLPPICSPNFSFMGGVEKKVDN
jgi:hypothetical protein